MNILLLTRKQSFFMIALNLIWQTLYPIELPRKAHWQKIAPEKYTILFSGPDTQQIISVKHNQKEILIGNTEQFLPTMNGMLEKLKQPESNIIVYKAFPTPQSKTSFWSLRKLFSPKYINETFIDQATKNPTTINNFENICIQAIYNFFRPNPLQSNSTRSKEKQRTLKILERMASNNNLAKTVYAMLFPAKPTSNKTRPIATTSNNPTDAVRRLISPTLEEREASLSRIAADQSAAKERNKQRSASFTQTVLLQDAIKELNDISNNADIEFESILNKEAANRQAIQAREELLHREETERKSLSEQGLTLPNEVVALKEKAAEIKAKKQLELFTNFFNNEQLERSSIIDANQTEMNAIASELSQKQREEQLRATSKNLKLIIKTIRQELAINRNETIKANKELKEQTAQWRATIAALRALNFAFKSTNQQGKNDSLNIQASNLQIQKQADFARAKFEMFELDRQNKNLSATLKQAFDELAALKKQESYFDDGTNPFTKQAHEARTHKQHEIIKKIQTQMQAISSKQPELQAQVNQLENELQKLNAEEIKRSQLQETKEKQQQMSKYQDKINLALSTMKKAEQKAQITAQTVNQITQKGSLIQEQLQQALALQKDLLHLQNSIAIQKSEIDEIQATLSQVQPNLEINNLSTTTEHRKKYINDLQTNLVEAKAILSVLLIDQKEVLFKCRQFLNTYNKTSCNVD